MTYADQEQRIEELQIALSRAFEARKRPSVSAIYDGDDIVLRVSWVTQSTRDTSLDARCALRGRCLLFFGPDRTLCGLRYGTAPHHSGPFDTACAAGFCRATRCR